MQQIRADGAPGRAGLVAFSRPRPLFEALARVESYWEALRDGRQMPARAELDPRGLGPALDHALLLEASGPGPARIRLAGAALAALLASLGPRRAERPAAIAGEPNAATGLLDMKRRWSGPDLPGRTTGFGLPDPRGLPLTALFALRDRSDIGLLIARAGRAPAVLRLGLSAASGAADAPRLRAALLLLPLRDRDGRPSRILAALETEGTPRGCRFAIEDVDTRPLPCGPGRPAPGANPRAAPQLRLVHDTALC